MKRFAGPSVRLDLGEPLHKVRLLEDLVELELVDDVDLVEGLERHSSGFAARFERAAAGLPAGPPYVS